MNPESEVEVERTFQGVSLNSWKQTIKKFFYAVTNVLQQYTHVLPTEIAARLTLVRVAIISIWQVAQRQSVQFIGDVHDSV